MPRALRLAATAVALLAGSLAAAAAQAPAASCGDVTIVSRVVEVRYKPVAEAAQLVNELLSPCGAVRVPKASRLLTVDDEPARLDRIAQALASWDLPPRTIEISVSLILASREPSTRGSIAREIRGVSETLSRYTHYSSFRLIGASTVRVSEGGTVEAALGEGYKVVFRVVEFDAQNRLARLDPLDLFREPDAREAAAGIVGPQRLLGWAQNVPEGKQHLVGAPGKRQDRALFLSLQVVAVDGESHPAGRD